LGSLAWEKNGKLRLSLDRADLWDERKALDISKLNFKWVEQQVLKNDYKSVQKIGDWPWIIHHIPQNYLQLYNLI
jgi:alpha-L-fucosidase 2